jgi:DNA-directed RNA polymerase specialized sigma24 family protein
LLDDNELLHAYLRDGDEGAITILYLRYQPQLLAYGTWHFQGDRAAAHDLVQDTWEAVLTYRALSPAGHFKGLVFRIAHSLTTNAARWRAARERAREELQRRDGRPIADTEICTYCNAIADSSGLCRAHRARRERGATEEEMGKPIRSYRRSK